MVDILQSVQDELADLVRCDLALERILQLSRNALNHILYRIKRNWALYGSSAKALNKLFSVERLDGIVLLYYHQRNFFNYLIGSKAIAALYALAAAAHLVLGGAGVNNLAFLTAAFGTFHNDTLLNYRVFCLYFVFSITYSPLYVLIIA